MGPERAVANGTPDSVCGPRADALGAPLAKAYLRRNNAKALERLRLLLAEAPALSTR